MYVLARMMSAFKKQRKESGNLYLENCFNNVWCILKKQATHEGGNQFYELLIDTLLLVMFKACNKIFSELNIICDHSMS